MGKTFQARRLTRHYSAYSVDPLFPPVAIRSLLKVLGFHVSPVVLRERSVPIRRERLPAGAAHSKRPQQSPRESPRRETPPPLRYLSRRGCSLCRNAHGDPEHHGGRERDDRRISRLDLQNIFKQIVAGYANLRAVGFYHCNLSAKTVFLQLKPSEENPGIPEILAKIAGFEQAVAVSSDGGFVVGESRVCGECSYAAPEVGGIFVVGDSVSGTVSARIRRMCGVWAWFCSFC